MYKTEIVDKLADLYSDYCLPGTGINPFPPEHWEAVFARPEIMARNDVIITSRNGNGTASEPAAFCWLYTYPAPSHVYLRGPYLSPEDKDVHNLLDFLIHEAVSRAGSLSARYIEGRAIYPPWRDAYLRQGFKRMGAYEKYRLFPLKGAIRHFAPPAGGTIRIWKDKSDIPVLIDLFDKSFSDHWDYVRPITSDWEKITGTRDFKPSLLLIAQSEGSPAGYIFGQLIPDFSTLTLQAGYLVSIGIHPAFRGRGWGRALVSEWLNRIYDTGTRAVELDVDDNNHAAKSLYLGFGFKKLRTEEVWRKYLREN